MWRNNRILRSGVASDALGSDSSCVVSSKPTAETIQKRSPAGFGTFDTLTHLMHFQAFEVIGGNLCECQFYAEFTKVPNLPVAFYSVPGALNGSADRQRPFPHAPRSVALAHGTVVGRPSDLLRGFLAREVPCRFIRILVSEFH